jgi:hypothetical protein
LQQLAFASKRPLGKSMFAERPIKSTLVMIQKLLKNPKADRVYRPKAVMDPKSVGFSSLNWCRKQAFQIYHVTYSE